MNIRLTEQQKIKIANSDDVFDIMQRVLKRENKIDQEKEHFWIIGLATNNRILFIELVSLGSLDSTVVEPMNVFRVAVLKGSAKIILVHNHPSGELQPSKNDNDITDRLIQVGRILSIEVIEHLIISLKSYISYSDMGLLKKLGASTKWIPSFEIEDRIKKAEKKNRIQAVKVAQEKGENKKALEMAKAMKEKGIEPSIIEEISGLPVKKIDKL